jgi:ketosteroid isomerase-like protein
MRVLFALLFCGVFCGAAAQERVDLGIVRGAISASHRLYFLAFSRGDSALFASLYTKDCWIMPAGGSTLCGDGAPGDFFGAVYRSRGVRNGKFITADVFGDGCEFVTETGFYRLVDGAGNVIDNGTYLVLWKKTADGWKRFRECFGWLDP